MRRLQVPKDTEGVEQNASESHGSVLPVPDRAPYPFGCPDIALVTARCHPSRLGSPRRLSGFRFWDRNDWLDPPGEAKGAQHSHSPEEMG